eukprot:5255944-Pyramimonas_sp.AAC.1
MQLAGASCNRSPGAILACSAELFAALSAKPSPTQSRTEMLPLPPALGRAAWEHGQALSSL